MEIFVETHPSVGAALKNKSILTNIFKYIRPQLQEYRLVNHVWNEVILSILPKRVKLSFNFEPRSYLTKRQHFEDQVARVRSLKVQNFCVMLSSRHLPKEAIVDIRWFMKNFGNKMKSVDLTFWLVNSASYSMLANILKNLSVVEEMILKVTFANKDPSQKEEKWPTYALLSVRKVGFKTVDFSTGHLEPSIVLDLMKLYPNMESLTVFPPNFSYNALNCIVESDLNLSKLDELHLWLDDTSLETSTKILERLSRLPNHNNLKVLDLDCFPELDHKIITTLEKVLQKHGPTLHSLRLTKLCVQQSNNNEKKDNNNFIISFPSFPLLRKLKLLFSYNCTDKVQPLIINFPSSTVEYEKDFPLLEDLEVCMDSEDCPSIPFPGNIVDIFLPLEGTTKSKRIKRAEFSIPEKWMKLNNVEWGTKFLENFQNTFPNASLMPMEKMVKWTMLENY